MSLPDVIDAVRPSMVQITFTVSGLSEEELRRLGAKTAHSGPLGTGFFINEDAYVVTAQHVIDDAREVSAQFPTAKVHVGVGLAYPNSANMRANFNVVNFDLVDEDNRHDLALLKLRANPFRGEVGGGIVVADQPLEPLHGVPSIRTERPRDGDGIAVSGYPLGETVLVTNQGVVASSWSVEVDEVAHPTIPTATIPKMRDIYLADVQSNPGNSGGPAYSSQDGAIVGVLVAGKLTSVVAEGQPAVVHGLWLSADAGLSLVVPAEYVVEMLDRNGVLWVRA